MTTESDRKAAEDYARKQYNDNYMMIQHREDVSDAVLYGINLERKRASERCLHGVLLGKSGECFECVPDIEKRASEGEAWISVEDKLPEDGQWVLAHAPNKPWLDRSPTFQKSSVVQFNRGNEFPIDVIEHSDKHGNNLVPYTWDEFGPDSWFGQDVSHWMPLPNVPVKLIKMNEVK